MARKLPPLNALRAFEAAARHLSFTRAADELHVTPAAVSHHVKTLEGWLGCTLFQRLPRSLLLTDAGRAALPTLTAGFDQLAQAIELMSAHGDGGLLTVSVSPAFGTAWLVPRLERFLSSHPGIQVHVDGTDQRADLAHAEADVAVRYGPGGYEGMQSDYLFGQRNVPVCAPALLAGDVPLREPDDLAHHTLLHIDWKDPAASWSAWLAAAGVTGIATDRGPRFTLETMAVQAAIDGHGVALVGSVLVADHVASGRLVLPFDPDLSTPLPYAYHLLSTPEAARLPKVVAFREWLLEEAKSEEQDTA